jgi:DNA-binding GntR family transcriptional regulator
VRAITPQPTLVDQVYESVLAEITEGKFGPDGRLIQEELAQSLGVSRHPVQQALLLLRKHGVLRDAPGRGLMVAPLDPDYVRNLFEVRGVLDGLASAKVAQIAADIARKDGPAYIARGRAAVKSRSIAQMTAADMDFHFFLYKLSGNPLIAEICGAHWSYVRRVMAEVLIRGQTPDDIWNQHEAILKNVMAGDAAQAEELARHHISHACEVLVLRLRQRLKTEAAVPLSKLAERTRRPARARVSP